MPNPGDRAIPLLLAGLAMLVWTLIPSATVVYIEKWGAEPPQDLAGMDTRFIPHLSLDDKAACDARAPAQHQLNGSLFRDSPQSCETVELKLYGTMHSRTKALQNLMRINPAGPLWKHSLPGTNSMPYNVFDACTRVIVAVRHPLIYCKRLQKEMYDMAWIGPKVEYKGTADSPDSPIVFNSCVEFWSEYYQRWLSQASLNPEKVVFVNSDVLLEEGRDSGSSLCSRLWHSLAISPLLPNGRKDLTTCTMPAEEFRSKPALNIHQKHRLEQRFAAGHKKRERGKAAKEINTLLRLGSSKSEIEYLSQQSKMFCYMGFTGTA